MTLIHDRSSDGWLFLPAKYIWWNHPGDMSVPSQHALLLEASHEYSYLPPRKKWGWLRNQRFQSIPIGQT
ncbi:hypothetical protein JAAARDRAFT_74706, partial [Jaapia argillacea MUCL 33604]